MLYQLLDLIITELNADSENAQKHLDKAKAKLAPTSSGNAIKHQKKIVRISEKLFTAVTLKKILLESLFLELDQLLPDQDGSNDPRIARAAGIVLDLQEHEKSLSNDLLNEEAQLASMIATTQALPSPEKPPKADTLSALDLKKQIYRFLIKLGRLEKNIEQLIKNYEKAEKEREAAQQACSKSDEQHLAHPSVFFDFSQKIQQKRIIAILEKLRNAFMQKMLAFQALLSYIKELLNQHKIYLSAKFEHLNEQYRKILKAPSSSNNEEEKQKNSALLKLLAQITIINASKAHRALKAAIPFIETKKEEAMRKAKTLVETLKTLVAVDEKKIAEARERLPALQRESSQPKDTTAEYLRMLENEIGFAQENLCLMQKMPTLNERDLHLSQIRLLLSWVSTKHDDASRVKSSGVREQLVSEIVAGISGIFERLGEPSATQQTGEPQSAAAACSSSSSSQLIV